MVFLDVLDEIGHVEVEFRGGVGDVAQDLVRDDVVGGGVVADGIVD